MKHAFYHLKRNPFLSRDERNLLLDVAAEMREMHSEMERDGYHIEFPFKLV